MPSHHYDKPAFLDALTAARAAAAPCAPLRRARSALAAMAVGLALASVGAHAAPEGGEVRQGDADIDKDDNDTNINQRSHRAVIDWRSFNVARNETVNFVQPDASSLTVNAIHDARPSEVFGRINANGRVALLNPRGVIFGRHSVVNVGALLAGASKFERIDERGRIYTSVGAVDSVLINGGLIQASQSVALVGTRLENSGTILARLGSVQLASGRLRTVDFDGNGLIHLGIAPTLEGSLNLADSSRVEANTIAVSISQADRIIDSLVNVDGVLRADAVERRNGQIVLRASNQGIDFGAVADAGEGGSIDVLSDGAVTIADAAEFSAPAGRVRIGGSYQGQDRSLMHASSVTVGEGARIDVSAKDESDLAGEAVVWSDGITDFHGSISARGENGSIEVSGKELTIGATARFELSPSGVLLLDPDVVTIDTVGTCTGTGDTSNPIPTDMSNCTIAPSVLEAVTTGTITVEADSTIIVNGAVTMGTGASLTLSTDGTESDDSITVNADVDGGDTFTISTGGTITGSGALAADTIVLTAGAIGSDGTSLTATADSSLSLTTTATSVNAGSIYVDSDSVPASLTVDTAGTMQTVNLSFTQATVELPTTSTMNWEFRAADTVDLSFTATATAPGAITVPAMWTLTNVDVLGLTATGIGSVGSPLDLAANAFGQLSLATLGASGAGNIYVSAAALPTTRLSIDTANGSSQTVNLDFNLTAAATTPAIAIGAGETAGDTIVLDISTTAGAITVGSAINLETIAAATSRLNLNAAAAITGSGDLTADTISLMAVGAIGTSTNRLTANASGTLSLETTGSSGDIYIGSTVLPTTSLTVTTATATPQTVDLSFTQAIDALELPTTSDPHWVFQPDDTVNLSFTATAGAITTPTTGALANVDDLDLEAGRALTFNTGITVSGKLTAVAGGNITGTGDLAAGTIELMAVGAIGTSATNRLTANASGTLSLATTGSVGNIYVGAMTLPAMELSIDTANGSSQTVNLDFDLTAAATTPTIAIVAGETAGDTIVLDISTTAGAITVGSAINLETIAAATSTLTLNAAAGALTGSGVLTADTISLTADGAIGTSTNRLTANASGTLSLATTGSVGNIYIGSTALPTTRLSIATATPQTVDLSFTVSGAAVLPSIAFAPADTATFSLTATGTGANITGGPITGADNIHLTAAGSIGAGSGSPLAASASGTLRLTTQATAAGAGNIHVRSADSVPSTLTVSTAGAAQTVGLSFTQATGDLTLPTTSASDWEFRPADTVELSFTATIGAITTPTTGSLANVDDLSLTAGGALTFNADTTVSGELTAMAGGNITGTGDLAAGTIRLTADGAIGTSATNRLTANASGMLSLATTGSVGNIYVGAMTLPATRLSIDTANGSSQTVNLDFNLTAAATTPTIAIVAGETAGDTIVLDIFTSDGAITVGSAINLETIAAATSTLNLNAAAALTGSGVLTADTISLTADGAIGTSATNRLTANASGMLSLETTGSVGNIYVGAMTLPATRLSIDTANGSSQMVNLDFDLTAAATTPAIAIVAGETAGDTIVLDISTTAGAITVGSAINLETIAAATSTLNLNAAAALTGPGVLTADTISLTAVGAIGTSTNRLTANASGTLGLETTGPGGNIYVGAMTLPTTALSIDTATATPQTVDLSFTVSGAAALPSIAFVPADTATFSLTATGTGANITGGPITGADTIRLTAGGAIGSSTTPLVAHASSSLRLETTGSGNAGSIYTSTNSVPATLTVSTATGTTQTVNLSFTQATGRLTLPASTVMNWMFQAADTVELSFNAMAGGIVSPAMGALANVNKVELTANDGIGSALAPVGIEASDSLSLVTRGTGSGGDVYLSLSSIPASISAPMTDAGSDQSIQILRAISGDVDTDGLGGSFPSVTPQSGDSLVLGYDVRGDIDIDTALDTGNNPVLLRASGLIAGVGTISGSNLTLIAASIGSAVTAGLEIMASDRLSVNAGGSLALATTGASTGSGHIHIDGTTLPATTLSIDTANGSSQTVDLDFNLTAAATTPTTIAIDAGETAGDTIVLDITTTAGDITVGSAINLETIAAATSTLNLKAAGALTGPGVLTADTISLTAVGAIGTSTNRLTANASGTLSLATTGSVGNIYVGAMTLPAMELSIDTANGSSQTVNLDFDLTAAATTPTIAIVAGETAGDTIVLDIFTSDGAITVGSAINLETIAAATSTLNLNAAAALTGPGVLTADTISLTAVGAIGTSTNRLTANASGTLSLATTGSVGNIYVGAMTLPAMELSIDTANGSSQTVNLDFDLTAAATTPTIAIVAGETAGDTIVLDISTTAGAITVGSAINLETIAAATSTLTLNAAAGALTGSGVLTADTISLTADGAIGTSTNRLTANASGTLSLATTGSVGNIYIGSTALPTTRLSIATATPQTVDLSFTVSGAAVLPSIAFAPADTATFSLTATGTGANITGGPITGADNIHLTAAGSIGAGSGSPLAASASGTLRLTTQATAAGAGNIHVSADSVPSTLTVSTAGTAQTVGLSFTQATGDLTLPTTSASDWEFRPADTVELSFTATIGAITTPTTGSLANVDDLSLTAGGALTFNADTTVSGELTAMAGGNITGPGVLTADTISLTAVGAIGTSATNRLTANASGTLSLATTGSVGNIYVGAMTLPATRLSIDTANGSSQTVNLDFDLTAAATTPAIAIVAGETAGDTIVLDISTTAGAITVGSAINLETIAAATSTLNLNAAASALTGSGVLTADTISLTADGAIGTSTNRLTANASGTLSLATTGSVGNIYIGSTALPTTRLSIATATPQTVDLSFTVSGAAVLPSIAFAPADTATFSLTATGTGANITGGPITGADNIHLTAAGSIGAGSGSPLAASASGTLRLTTQATAAGAGNIHVSADSVPSTLTVSTAGTAQTVGLSFTQATGDLTLPTTSASDWEFRPADTVELSFTATIGAITTPTTGSLANVDDLSLTAGGALTFNADTTVSGELTAMAGGNITGTGVLTADTISLTAVGAIGTSATNRLTANASGMLSLATTGSVGNIYVGAMTLPATRLSIDTANGSSQTVNLDFDLTAAATTPAIAIVAGETAGDTIVLDISTTAGAITVGSAINLETIAAATSTLTLNAAAGALTGSGVLTADTISLTADGAIGTSATNRLTANASSMLSLETTGSVGNIYVGAMTLPATRLSIDTANGSSQMVNLDFDLTAAATTPAIAIVAGETAGDTIVLDIFTSDGAITVGSAINLETIAAATSTLNLNAADGALTGSGDLAADTISLTADGAIGTSATNRLTANASGTLSLATTGSGGNIYVGAMTLPATTLSIDTANGSSQMVNLDFDLTAAATTPAIAIVAGETAGDTIVLDIFTSDGAITVGSAINLETIAAATSTLNLNAAALTLNTAGDITADAITLTATAGDITANADITATAGLTATAGGSLTNSGAITADAITLTATAGDITANGAITATAGLTATAGGSLTGSGALAAGTIKLTAAGGIGTSTNRLTANASGTLSLATTGPGGNIYVGAMTLPATKLSIDTANGSSQMIDLSFTVSGVAVLPSIAIDAGVGETVTAGDTINLDIVNTAGSISVRPDINLERIAATSSSLSLSATLLVNLLSGSLTSDTITLTASRVSVFSSFGALAAGTIRLKADGAIGTSANRLTANASDTLSLETTGSGGNIYVGAMTLPATRLSIDTANGSSQTVNLDFDLTAAATTPAIAIVAGETAGDTIVLDISTTAGAITVGSAINLETIAAATSTLTLNAAAGALTGSGVLTADTISLTADGAIGTSTNRLTANASGTLSLATTGSVGNIYIGSTALPTTRLSIDTANGSSQTVDLDFDLTAAATTPTAIAIDAGVGETVTAGDTIVLDISTTAGDITVGSAINLERIAASMGTLNLKAAAALTLNTGGAITADAITLTATAGAITADADITATGDLTATAGGSLTGSGALAAGTIELTAAGGIGTSANRLTANASGTLSLETTGSGGNIYVGAMTLPATRLSIDTANDSSQTVDLDFDLTAAATTPTAIAIDAGVGETVTAGDTIVLDISTTVGDITVGSAINLERIAASMGTLNLKAAAALTLNTGGAITADAITLTATAGDITANADITATGTAGLTATAGGSLTGSGALAAGTIELTAAGGIGTSANRLTANASGTLSLETTGSGGNIYVGAMTLPATRLSIDTANGSSQTVNLDFDLTAAATTPAIAIVAGETAGDTIVLDISTTAGAITVGSAINLETIAAATSTLNLKAAAALTLNTGGAITADAITLTATAGAITADADITATGDLTATAGGSLTGSGALAAGTIELTAAGGIGTSATNRLTANASGTLSLETTGSGGNIYVGAMTLPAMRLSIDTANDSSQTVDLDFNLTAAATTPTAIAIDDGETVTAGDTIVLDISTTAGNINVGSAINLERIPAATSMLTLNVAAGALTGSGALAAGTIELTAAGGIGTSANRLTANASGTLSLETTGPGGNIYVGAMTLPATRLSIDTANDSSQTVNLDFDLTAAATTPAIAIVAGETAGDTIVLDISTTAGAITVGSAINLETIAAATSTLNLKAAAALTLNTGGAITADAITLTATAGAITADADITATGDLTATAGGSLTGSGALAAGTIELTAAGGIGTSATNRLTANASGTLSLETTGSGGNIYVGAMTLPTMRLSIDTANDSSQTVDLDFNLTAAATTPTTIAIDDGETVTAGDTIVLDISTTAGNITVGSPINLETIATATSTLNLNAAGDITGGGVLTADTIDLTAAGAIGTSANRLTADASGTLSLETTGSGGNIYVGAMTLPTMRLSIDTANDSSQTVHMMIMDKNGDITLPTTDFTGTKGTEGTDGNDTISIHIEALSGNIFVDKDLLLPVPGSTLTLVTSGSVTTANTASVTKEGLTLIQSSRLRADTINIEAQGIGNRDGLTTTEVLIEAMTLNSRNEMEDVIIGGDIFIKLRGNLRSGRLVTRGLLSINTTPDMGIYSIGNPLAGSTLPNNHIDFSAATAGLNEMARTAIENSMLDDNNTDTIPNNDFFSFHAARLYVGAPSSVKPPSSIPTTSTASTRVTTGHIVGGDNAEMYGSVSMLYLPDAIPSDGDSVLRLQYVNSVRDFVLSARDSKPVRLIIGEVGLYGAPNAGFAVQDVALHNFQSFHNGYGLVPGQSVSLLVSDTMTATDITGAATAQISSPAIANFNVSQLYLFTTRTNNIPNPNFNSVGAQSAPLVLDRRQGSNLKLVAGHSGIFYLQGTTESTRYGSPQARVLGGRQNLINAGIVFELTGEVGQPTVVSAVSSFRAAEDFSLFLDTSVFLTFDLVVYSDEANATCSSYTFEEPGDEENEAEGCV